MLIFKLPIFSAPFWTPSLIAENARHLQSGIKWILNLRVISYHNQSKHFLRTYFISRSPSLFPFGTSTISTFCKCVLLMSCNHARLLTTSEVSGTKLLSIWVLSMCNTVIVTCCNIVFYRMKIIKRVPRLEFLTLNIYH